MGSGARHQASQRAGQRALLVDYGGVLTVPVDSAFTAFEHELGVPPGSSYRLLVTASTSADGGPIGALERGELDPASFEAVLRRLLADAGHRVPDEVALLDGFFARMPPAGTLWEVVEEVRSRGVRTGLLSNSWGFAAYPFDRLRAGFDDLVLSGQVGLRKPDPAIYLLAAERLQVDPHRCVFVDDLDANVEVARSLGMVGIHHRGDDRVTGRAILAALAP